MTNQEKFIQIFGYQLWGDVIKRVDPILDDFWTSPYKKPIICGNCGEPVQNGTEICPKCSKKILNYEKT